jgi:bla regulator protein blaR1
MLGPIVSAIPGAAASAAQSADHLSYVFFAPGSRTSTMSGSADDMSRARSLRPGNEGLLYVRHGDITYLIRDAATLRQVQVILEPQEAVAAQQQELGSRQVALGLRQGELGAEQGRLGRQQAEASPSRASELGRKQSELGRQQSELSRQQADLGTQQAALGREQSRLAHLAAAKLRALLAEAVHSGVATARISNWGSMLR